MNIYGSHWSGGSVLPVSGHGSNAKPLGMPGMTAGRGTAGPTLDLQFDKGQWDSRIVFTRASTATFIGPDGLIQTAAANVPRYQWGHTSPVTVNMHPYSQSLEFSANNNVTNTGATTDTTDPFGVYTALKSADNAVSGAHRPATSSQMQAQFGLGYYTGSVYAKVGTKSRFILLIGGSVPYGVGFDLSDQTTFAGTGGEIWTDNWKIEDVGSGWYRCSVTANLRAGFSSVLWYPQLQIRYVADSGGTNSVYAGTGTYMYFFGSQFEPGAVATEYIPTYTASEANFLQPATVEQKRLGYLSENQITNLATYTEDLSNAVWTKTGVTISSDATTAPDGATTADLVIPDGTTSIKYVRHSNFTIVASTYYNYSVFVKAAGYTKVGFREGIFSGAAFVVELTGAGRILRLSTWLNPKIQALANDWYRISVCIASGANTSMNVAMHVLPAAWSGDMALNTYTWAGDTTSGVYMWGAQMEASVMATSYTPTPADTPAVRVADNAAIFNMQQIFNREDFTIHAENICATKLQDSYLVGLYDWRVAYQVALRKQNAGYYISVIRDWLGNNSDTHNGSSGVYEGRPFKTVVTHGAYSPATQNNFGWRQNGDLRFSQEAGWNNVRVNFQSFDYMTIGRSTSAGYACTTPLVRLTIWPYRMTYSQLQDLTKYKD